MLWFQPHLERRGCFSLCPHRHGCVVHLPSPEKGRKEHGPFGGASSSCKGQGGGNRRLCSQKFPFPTTSSLPWGLGRGKWGLTIPSPPPCARSPRTEAVGTGGRRRELSWINSRSEARGASGPLGNHIRAGERPLPTPETPVLRDLCLQPHRGCVCPPE